MRHNPLRGLITFPTTRLLAISFLAFGFSHLSAFAADPPKEINIDYARECIGRSSTGRPSISQPAAGALPLALAAPRPSGELALAELGGGRDAANGLKTRAAVAATWTARQQIQIFGRREIYQAGLYDGLQQAFHDPLIGDWDQLQGHHAGRRAREAFRIGSELGAEQARIVAAEDAYARITAQFHDLTRDPRAKAQPDKARRIASRQERAMEQDTPIPVARKPRLLDVFDDVPLSSFLTASERGPRDRHHELEPLPDPFKLYRSDSYDDFMDRRWTEPGRAFDYWLDHHRDSAFWRQLNDHEKVDFAEIFRFTFSRQLHGLLADAGEHAYGEGHGDGWNYGVLVVQEWSHRKGYHEGFTSALQQHARSAFRDRYPRLLDDRYGELFREWSTTAKPEIRKVVVVDGSGDGVFEPGEEMMAHYELVNYGGRGEQLRVSLAGDPLKDGASADVYLPRRGVLRSQGPLAARIDPNVPLRSQAEIELTVGGLGHRVALRIANPLTLDDASHPESSDLLLLMQRIALGQHRVDMGDMDATPLMVGR